MNQHSARELAQVCKLQSTVADVDIGHGPNDCSVTIRLRDHRIRPRILGFMAAQGAALDPDATETRGDPTETVVVAR